MKDFGKDCNRMPEHSRCLKMKQKGKCPTEELGTKCPNGHRLSKDVFLSSGMVRIVDVSSRIEVANR